MPLARITSVPANIIRQSSNVTRHTLHVTRYTLHVTLHGSDNQISFAYGFRSFSTVIPLPCIGRYTSHLHTSQVISYITSHRPRAKRNAPKTNATIICKPNPKPQTSNPKPQTPNPKPQTPNPKPQTPNLQCAGDRDDARC